MGCEKPYEYNFKVSGIRFLLDTINFQVSDCVGIHVSDIRIVASPNVRFHAASDGNSATKLTNYWTW